MSSTDPGTTSAAADSVPFLELLPNPGSTEVHLPDAYAYPARPDRPWVRANMVASADGGTVDPSGGSRELSSAPDRKVMGVLRGLCDVVLVGAATARAEGYGPVRARRAWAGLRQGRPAAPAVAVVSRSLELPDRLLDAPANARTIVFTTAQAPAERREQVAAHTDLVVTEGGSVHPERIVAALAERGMYRVLTEGGPHLLAEFQAAGLLDELCLTLSPHLMGAGPPRVVAGTPGAHQVPESVPEGAVPVRLAHVLEAQGNLFTRYVRGQGDAGGSSVTDRFRPSHNDA